MRIVLLADEVRVTLLRVYYLQLTRSGKSVRGPGTCYLILYLCSRALELRTQTPDLLSNPLRCAWERAVQI
jgi:hypothetical protein